MEERVSLMKRAALAIVFLCFIVSCARFLPEEDIPYTGDIRELGMPENITDEFSYVFGYMLASSASEYGQNINYEYMARGVLDYASRSAFYAESEMNRILTLHQRHMINMDLRAEEELSESNRESAWAFLIANGKRRSVITLPSGIEYEILRSGDGASAENALVVSGEYQLSLPDGSIAFSTYENGELDEIVLSDVIPGLEEGIRAMHEGDQIRLWVPPELGFVDSWPQNIEPNSLLIFDIELSDIVEQADEVLV